MTRPKIILADDHPIFVAGLATLLESSYTIAAIAEDGEELLKAVERHEPDVVVSDLSMPKLNGVDCVRQLQGTHPDVKIILLTMHDDIGLAVSAIRAGASGYLLKLGGAKEVKRAIDEALKGGVHISPQIAREVLQALSKPGERANFTPRQEEIVRLLILGNSAKEVAAKLHLSPRTVEFHKYEAIKRVGVNTTAELIAFAVEQGLK